MKTRYKIIVVIFIASSLVVILPNYWLEFDDSGVFVCDRWFDSHYACNRIWLDPVPVNLDAERDSDWITGEDYCQEWCDNDELYRLGCDQPILAHLTKHSNLLDEEFDGTYSLDWIGLPDGVSTEKFEWCVDFIYDKRLPSEEDLGIQLDHWENMCSGVVPQCFATFDNETEVRIQCPDYPWKCGISNFDAGNYKITDNETIQTVIDYCTHKLKLALGEIPSRNPDGSYNILLDYPLVFENQTHYMDNNNCQLIQTWDGYSHPFGYEYEDKVIFSINTLEE